MPKTQMSLRLSTRTRAQLHTLQADWQTTQTEVVTLAIDRMYQALPALTRKVAENIGAGLWAEYGDGDIVAVNNYSYDAQEFDDSSFEVSGFTLSYHHGDTPAFDSKPHGSLATLITAMQAIEPSARKWHVCTE